MDKKEKQTIATRIKIPYSLSKLPSKATKSQKKQAYYLLGLLSAKFAEFEIKIHHLLGSLCRFEGIIEYYLIEENSLDKNMQLLKKLNALLEFETDQIDTLNKKVSGIRVIRNKLIHGKWDVFRTEAGEPVVSVLDYKIIKKETKYGQMLQRGYQRIFSFNELEDLTKNVQELSKTVDDLVTLSKEFYRNGNNRLHFNRR